MLSTHLNDKTTRAIAPCTTAQNDIFWLNLKIIIVGNQAQNRHAALSSLWEQLKSIISHENDGAEKFITIIIIELLLLLTLFAIICCYYCRCIFVCTCNYCMYCMYCMYCCILLLFHIYIILLYIVFFKFD